MRILLVRSLFWFCVSELRGLGVFVVFVWFGYFLLLLRWVFWGFCFVVCLFVCLLVCLVVGLGFFFFKDIRTGGGVKNPGRKAEIQMLNH